MALLSVIWRWYHRDQMSIREISRRTGLSRNTLRKCLRSEVVEPRFRTPDRPSKLDPYADRLSAWLKREFSLAAGLSTITNICGGRHRHSLLLFTPPNGD